MVRGDVREAEEQPQLEHRGVRGVPGAGAYTRPLLTST